MSFSIRIHQIGRHGASVGSTTILSAATEDDALALTRAEIRKLPRASRPMTFSIYDKAQRLIISYTTRFGALSVANTNVS